MCSRLACFCSPNVGHILIHTHIDTFGLLQMGITPKSDARCRMLKYLQCFIPALKLGKRLKCKTHNGSVGSDQNRDAGAFHPEFVEDKVRCTLQDKGQRASVSQAQMEANAPPNHWLLSAPPALSAGGNLPTHWAFHLAHRQMLPL